MIALYRVNHTNQSEREMTFVLLIYKQVKLDIEKKKKSFKTF